jgi:type IV secretion system protein VirB2
MFLLDVGSVRIERTKRPLRWVDLAEGRLKPRSPMAQQRRQNFLIRRRSAMSFASRRILSAIAGTLATIAATMPAYAAGSNMPWEQPLQQILESVEGPVAKIIAVIIIIVTGLTLAFGDTSGGFRRLIQIVFGLSIAFAASSFFLSFFSFGGGVLV